MKGRPPKETAVRRGLKPTEVTATVIEALAEVEKPESVLASPHMERVWDAAVKDAPDIRQVDSPLLELYCAWYAIGQQAMRQVITPEGKIVTLTGKLDPSTGGYAPESLRAAPDIHTLQVATDNMRRLASELNITPAGRARAGLVDAMTKSTQADVIRKTELGFEEFRKRLGNG